VIDSNFFQKSVECIDNNAPHSKAAKHLLECINSLTDGPESYFLRSILTWQLFHRTEVLLEKEDFDIEEYSKILQEMGDWIILSSKIQNYYSHKLNFGILSDGLGDFRIATQDHYGNLFQKFDENHYFNEPVKLLRERLTRSGINLGDISKQVALDAGCGGGRYSYALRSLGFGRVVGLDFSEININTATERMRSRSTDGMEFKVGNVLQMPFEDATFDFVFSNGVLHHTESIKTGLQEMRRVMKETGRAWLYVIESPGGLHWDMVELLRNAMKPVNRGYARTLFSLIGVPTNRIFYILDHIMVPINTRTSIADLEYLMRKVGFNGITRLDRGADFDRIEQIYQKGQKGAVRDITWKYGVGEHRYILTA
jgi:ubiquinone/menaquinone biosynthesis C-methylase UbiE